MGVDTQDESCVETEPHTAGKSCVEMTDPHAEGKAEPQMKGNIENASYYSHPLFSCVCVCVFMCAHVCACVCVCVIFLPRETD